MQWILILSVMVSMLYGAPAFHGEQRFEQPDGSSFSGRQCGDEYLHWIESKRGDIVLFNKQSRRFEHAEIVGDTLQANGEPFRDTKDKRSVSGFQSKSSSEALQNLWMEKRAQAIKRRRDARRDRSLDHLTDDITDRFVK